MCFLPCECASESAGESVVRRSLMCSCTKTDSLGPGLFEVDMLAWLRLKLALADRLNERRVDIDVVMRGVLMLMANTNDM